VRAATLLAKEEAGAPDAAVDDHPDAADAFARLAAGAGGGGHLVAPALGSSAALALEIARLEAEEFDEDAAISEILAARRVADAVVERTLRARAAARRVGARTAEDVLREEAEAAESGGEGGGKAVALDADATAPLP
jgi:hypothetical protein